jgi:hypothetical protein
MNEIPLVPVAFRKVVSAAWLLHVHRPADFPDYTVKQCMRVALSIEGYGNLLLDDSERKLLEETKQWPFERDEEFAERWKKKGYGTLVYLSAKRRVK